MVEDHFWEGKTEYLNEASIPKYVSWSQKVLAHGESFPILYGKDAVTYGKESVTCSIDIFASAFFMLTRWEEKVLTVRDEFDRFPARRAWRLKQVFIKNL